MKKMIAVVLSMFVLAILAYSQNAAPKYIDMDSLRGILADTSKAKTIVYNGARITIPAKQKVTASEDANGNLVLSANPLNLSINNKAIVSEGPAALVVDKSGKSISVQHGVVVLDSGKGMKRITPANGLVPLEEAPVMESEEDTYIYLHIADNLAAQQATQNKFQTSTLSPAVI